MKLLLAIWKECAMAASEVNESVANIDTVKLDSTHVLAQGGERSGSGCRARVTLEKWLATM